MTDDHEIALTVNGERRTVTVDCRRTLADVLREDLGLYGTNVGCEQGICGTCTVLLEGEAVRSCLLFGVQADGRSIETVEGSARTGELDDLREAMSRHRGLQCGFCTPGFLVLVAGLLRDLPPGEEPDDEEILDALSSNLCRCTGYQGIVAAVREVAGARASGGREAP